MCVKSQKDLIFVFSKSQNGQNVTLLKNLFYYFFDKMFEIVLVTSLKKVFKVSHDHAKIFTKFQQKIHEMQKSKKFKKSLWYRTFHFQMGFFQRDFFQMDFFQMNFLHQSFCIFSFLAKMCINARKPPDFKNTNYLVRILEIGGLFYVMMFLV